MTATNKPVFVFRCSKCSLEYYSLLGRKPVVKCGRCDNTFLPRRRIAAPHTTVTATTEREDAARAG